MKQQKKKSRRQVKKPSKKKDERASWIDRLEFLPVNDDSSSDNNNNNNTDTTTTAVSISIVSWNLLAESYCSRRSQCNLPRSYQQVVFSPHRRRRCMQRILQECFADVVDVLCLQELDAALQDTVHSALAKKYACVETPTSSGSIAGRVDACAIYVQRASWEIREHERIRLDDLATLSDDSSSSSESTSNLQGIQQSFLRRNMALLVRLRHLRTGQTVVVANAHLFWHPSYEYVKLMQAHYILQRAKAFSQSTEECVFFCGDLNSRPHGVTHTYLSRGWINAKLIAPWYSTAAADARTDDSSTTTTGSRNESGDDKSQDDSSKEFVDEFGQLNLTDDPIDDSASPPQVRYLLDYTLNKLCRWLRILGQDTALETEQEERLRTGLEKQHSLLFDKCLADNRTMVTTSTRLVQRRDCPSSVYCINPTFLPHLEVALVHMLLTHGVVLEPSKFLSRCVVCNGNIVGVDEPAMARAILEEYQAHEVLLKEESKVYQCDGCGQGYWWSDKPTSSASRVKMTATRLWELCLRAGVPWKGPVGMFEHVPAEILQREGWDATLPGSELLQQRLQVIDWLKCERLDCPLQLESAYAQRSADDDDSLLIGERVPFTNVTSDFVDTLDYICFEKSRRAKLTDRLYVPMSFSELNRDGVRNGHLLPSDVWPSDHLAIGARFALASLGDAVTEGTEKEAKQHKAPSNSIQYCLPANGESTSLSIETNLQAMNGQTSSHGQRCGCGCVPAVPSLFEMAELRRQARLKAFSESG